MKATIKVSKEVNFTHLKVKCGVRYWEDGTVNGVEDKEGDLIPLREGDYWCPVIELESGQIMDWPIGVTASVHYKCCDDGDYWLITAGGFELKRPGYYVPDILDLTKESFGDYVILDIDQTGLIKNWPKKHNIDDFLVDDDD